MVAIFHLTLDHREIVTSLLVEEKFDLARDKVFSIVIVDTIGTHASRTALVSLFPGTLAAGSLIHFCFAWKTGVREEKALAASKRRIQLN